MVHTLWKTINRTVDLRSALSAVLRAGLFDSRTADENSYIDFWSSAGLHCT